MGISLLELKSHICIRNLLTSRNLQFVFNDRIGTKFKQKATNRLVMSTSIASAFCTNGGIARLSTLSNRVRGSMPT